MQVEAISAAINPLETLSLQPLRNLSAPASPTHPSPATGPPPNDIAAALVTQIASTDMARLNAILQSHRSPEVAAHVTELTHDATLALTQGDRSRALTNLTEIAAVDPHTLPVLAAEKVLEPIRPEVEHLLNRMTTVAKMDAEGWLTQADQAVETPGHEVSVHWQTKPQTVLEVAHRLFDSGGYTNYVRSADLAQTIVNPSGVAYSPFLEQYAASVVTKPLAAAVRPENEEVFPKKPAVPALGEAFRAIRSTAMPRLQVLWNRAPLLALLLGWFTAGLVAGPAALLLRALWPETWPAFLVDLSFEIWGIGFLALVCFGFYARIRDIRVV